MLPSHTATVTPGPKLNQRRAWLKLAVWAPPPLPHTCHLHAGARGRTASTAAPVKLQTLES